MAPPSEELASRRSRSRNIFLSLLLCQLIWIFPVAFFLLSSSSETVILPDTRSRNLYGPFKAFDDDELERLKKIDKDWSEFRNSIKETFNRKGLMQPWDKSCFIWIPDCYLLAKHQKIIQAVEQAIGPNLLLYGMQVWRGRSDPMETFHKDMESVGCEMSMNFISGRTVQIISQSHKATERTSQIILRILHQFEKQSLAISGQNEQLSFFEKFFTPRLKHIARNADLRFENIRGQKGYGVLFHGGTIYRVSNDEEDEGLLMQFVSSDCRVRVSRNNQWGLHGISKSLSMPPVLLVSGNLTNDLRALNDIRLSLAKNETPGLTIDIEQEDASQVLGSKLGPSSHNDFWKVEPPDIEVFVDSSASNGWHTHGIWKSWQVAEIRTSLIDRGRVDRFLLSEGSFPADFDRVSGDDQQVLVVLHRGMQYFRASNDGELRHWELLELTPGGAVLLLGNLIHAFRPLGEEASFLSFQWIGYGDNNSTGMSGLDHRHMMLGNAILPSRCYLTYPTGGQTITLMSGQAYDPEDAENCDVLVFMVEGQLLQILPSDETIQAPSTLVIPAGKSPVLWNIGRQLVKFFAMHVCHCEDGTQIAMSFAATGKIF